MSVQDKKVDSLGLEVNESSYELTTKKSVLELLTQVLEGNPAAGMAVFLVIIIFIYMMAVFHNMSIFHWLGTIICIFFILWVSFVDDARIGYKLFSISLIFMSIIIFLSIK